MKTINPSANDARDFRPPRYVLVLAICVVALASGMTVLSFSSPSPLWQRAFAVMFVLLASLGVLETILKRVRLENEAVHLVHPFRERRIPRSEIESVTWAKGTGVSLKLVNGDWVRLPEVGNGSQALANSIRAWLKRTR